MKQADLVLAVHLRAEEFGAEQQARNFEYYERITVQDSSLSACSQAVLAAATGRLGLAYDYVSESSLIDIVDLEHNTSDGLHMASLAGAWVALVEGLGGVRLEDSRLALRPRLPDNLHRLRFRILHFGRRIEVSITSGQARYRLVAGASVSVCHYDEEVRLAEGTEQRRAIPMPVARRAASQPPGREPGRRRRGT